MLAQIKSGEVKYQLSKVDDMKLFVDEDAAVVNGRWRGKFVEKSKAIDTVARFTDTFVRRKRSMAMRRVSDRDYRVANNRAVSYARSSQCGADSLSSWTGRVG